MCSMTAAWLLHDCSMTAAWLLFVLPDCMDCCMDGAVIYFVPAGLYSSSLTARLAHLCDTVIGLEAVRDDSDIVRVIPEPARYVTVFAVLLLPIVACCLSMFVVVTMVMRCYPEHHPC